MLGTLRTWSIRRRQRFISNEKIQIFRPSFCGQRATGAGTTSEI